MIVVSLKRIYGIFLRQLFLLKRSKYRIFNLFHWAVLDLVLWGLITTYLRQVSGEGFQFFIFLLGAIIMWNFLIRVQQGITISFLEDVWTRNLMNLFGSPLTVSEYIFGLVLVGVFQGFLQGVFMVLLAWLLFAYNIFQYGFLLIPFIIVLFVFGLALGVFSTAIILRAGPSSEMMAWFIPAWIAPLSGIFYPIATLPVWMQYIALALPSTYIFEGMRAALVSGRFDIYHFLIALLLSFIFLAAAYWFLFRSYRYVLHRGLFTRFMTE